MSQKAFSKHSEYRTYSTKGTFDDKNFESMKSELLPAKYGSLIQPNNGAPANNKEFYYEYKEEKNPAGTYDKRDLHTVEQYEYTSPGDSGYNYNSSSGIKNSPQRIMNTTTTTTNRDLSHNIEELDSLLDDLQKDQERKLYKGGYTSDVLESSSFDYKPTTPVKSGYSSLSRVERDAEWIPAQPPTVTREINREIVRNHVTTESHILPSHILPAAPQPVPAVICTNCQSHPNASVSTPMNKVTTTVKTYTYEVPADQDPASIPIPGTTPPKTTVAEKYHTTDRSYIQENQEHRTYANTHFNTSTPVKQPPPSPQPGCQYCSHCNSCITTTKTTSVAGSPMPQHHHPLHSHPSSPHANETTKITTRTTNYTTAYPDNRGPPYPSDSSPTYAVPVDNAPKPDYPPNQGPNVYKYTTTNYTTYNTTDGRGKPAPFPAGNLSPPTSPSPFPRTESPAPRTQEPPKRLGDLMADFPGHENYHTDHDGLRMRPNPARGPGGSINGNLAVRETAQVQTQSSKGQEMAVTPSKNVAGPAVYYPPGHEMFTRKEEGLAYQQAGGGYMKARGKYEYEAESRSKSKSSATTTKSVVCLPLCCGLPCSIL